MYVAWRQGKKFLKIGHYQNQKNSDIFLICLDISSNFTDVQVTFKMGEYSPVTWTDPLTR